VARAPARRTPWAKTKAARRAISPDVRWAAEITRRILHDCHPWQLDAAMDPAKRITLQVGRGGAKTTTERARAIIKITTLRRQKVGYAAGSKEQARLLNWNKFTEACEAYEIRTATTNVVSKAPDLHLLDAAMVATCLRTGSSYHLRGVEDRADAEKFRGYPQAEFQVDEAGSMRPELLEHLVDACVAPRLGEALALPPGWLEFLAGDEDLELLPEFVPTRGGAIILASTPPPTLRGIFYEATREGSPDHRRYAERERPEYAGWLGYSSHAWTLQDVVSLPDADRYPALQANWAAALREKQRKGWADDHPTWMREYLGLWSADNTSTVFRFRPHLNGEPWNQWDVFGDRPLDGLPGLLAAIAKLPKDVGTWHYVIAMDMGSRDPFALNVFAFAPRDPARRMIHVHAFERQGMFAKTIAELLLGPALDANKPGGILGAIGWPDGMIIDADQALIDELKNVYGLQIRKAERKMDYKYGAIELVNGDLIEGRIWILKGSPLAKQIAELQWKPDEYGNPREDKAQANHSTDTLIYARRLVANLFESGVVEAEGMGAAPPPAAYVDPQGLDGSGDSDEEGYGSLLASADYDDPWGG
jgi:hypothetical protein